LLAGGVRKEDVVQSLAGNYITFVWQLKLKEGALQDKKL
jgi:hypothetical protein